VSVFLTDEIELRTGWRFAAYWMTYIILFLATSAAMSEIIPGPVDFGEIRGLALSTLTLLPPAALTFAFMLRFVDRRPAAVFGVTLHEGWSRDLAVGLTIAAGMVVVYTAGAGLLSGLGADRTGLSGSGIALTVILLSIAAASEELVYRGYPFQILIQATGPFAAVFLMSAAFGFGHHFNPNATWLGTFNTFLAGVLLSLAYLRTRSLWLPYGIHIGWNLAIGVGLGLPVSGVRLDSIWTTSVGGPSWLTGGSFGPEGGILATIVIIGAAAFLGCGSRSLGTDHQEVH
jgi:hypothetical protein